MRSTITGGRMAAAIALCLALGIPGCGGSETTRPTDNPPAAAAPPPPGAAAVQETTARPTWVGYAAVAQLDLWMQKLPFPLAGAQLSVVEGVAEGLTVKDGAIRFITPTDPGHDTHLTLKAVRDGQALLIPVVVRSERPTEPGADVHGTEDGRPPVEDPNGRLVVTGLGPMNALRPAALTIAMPGAPALDPRGSSGTVFVPSTRQVVDFARYWVHDPATNTLTVPADKMAELLAQLPSAQMVLDIGLSGQDSSFGRAWSVLVHKPTAPLRVQVVGLDGRPQRAAAGRKVAVRGMGNENGTRIVATVDANGAFETEPLVAGMYRLSLLDAAEPDFWTTAVPVYPGSTWVNTQLLYEPDLVAKSALVGVGVG